VPSPILTFLKYLFLVVLYLFFLRVLRAVWTELREPQPGPAAAGETPVSRRQARRERRTAAREDRAAARHPEPRRLAVVEPPDRAGGAFDLGDELTVGRAPGCGVSVPSDTFVSQVHARVFRRDGAWWVEDLGSTNGTFVNDHKVSAPAPLHPGDRLKVGRTILELVP
jgi:hypothetical protein